MGALTCMPMNPIAKLIVGGWLGGITSVVGCCTQTQAKIRSIWTDHPWSPQKHDGNSETLDKASAGPCSCPWSAGGGWGAGAPTTASEWLP